jgi:hypothetical protein
VRWAQRGVPLPVLAPTAIAGAPPSLEIDLAGAGAVAFAVSAVTGKLTSSTGAAYPLEIGRVGPSLYQATLPLIPPGVYGFDLEARGSSGLTATGLVAVPYSLEYLPRAATDTPLAPLAALTGGHALRAARPESLAGGGQLSLWWSLTLGALALFMVGAIGRQLERSRGGHTVGSHDMGDDRPSRPREDMSASAAHDAEWW